MNGRAVLVIAGAMFCVGFQPGKIDILFGSWSVATDKFTLAGYNPADLFYFTPTVCTIENGAAAPMWPASAFRSRCRTCFTALPAAWWAPWSAFLKYSENIMWV